MRFSQIRPTALTWCRLAGVVALAAQLALCGCAGASQDPAGGTQQPDRKTETLETATFASGCFWCSEAIFERVEGVKQVISGYAGGTVENPTYQQVCSGLTGHAEAVQITFDPTQVSYADLLEIFWKTHDPTTLNRQGPDIGTQYRSAVFYHNDEQKKIAEEYKRQLDESKVFKAPIVTEVTALTNFFPAEKYHQDFYELNPRHGYCKAHITEKIDKFKRMFRDKVKTRESRAETRKQSNTEN